jgi:branched-subunit amino acid ABC-type transport system permease component
MMAHSLVTYLVLLAFAYSVVIGIVAVVTMSNDRTKPRCVAILIVVIGVLYLVQSAILILQGDHTVIHPIAAIVSTLSVAVNLLAIKIFIKESTNECVKGQCHINQRVGKV